MDKIWQLCFFLGLLGVVPAAEVRYGSYINNLVNGNAPVHEVTGDVYVVDANTILIKNFYYDGLGPDAFFYIGKKGGPSSTPSGQGEIIPNEIGSMAKLSGYSNADIVLKLPTGVTVDMLLWFSVWCRQASANFGSVMFPNTLTIPSTRVIGGFPDNGQHGVKSSTITILNSRQIKIMNFNYDGQGPDTFFWVGKGTPDSNGWAIPNEMGNMDILKQYVDKTITLTLPHGTTVYDIDYLSVWCKKAATSFSSIRFTNSSQLLIPYVMNLEGYYGQLIGDLKEYAHEVRGTVYLVDANTIRIRHFYYDGKGPDSFFWIGSSDSPDTSGTMIPNELGETTPLQKYTNADVVIKVPAGVIASSTWFSVWCKQASANFADITFPKRYTAPATVSLGQFSQLAHGVRSGAVTLLSTRTIRIENLHYDGAGPDAFFWVGVNPGPSRTGWIVPDENGSKAKLGAYTGQTVILTLPEEFSFTKLAKGTKVDWLSMWCRLATQDFGNVKISEDALLLPPYVKDLQPTPLLKNCEQLNEYFNIAWEIDDAKEYITYEFTGALDDGDSAMGYMSFGLSGSTTRSAMIGADVFVVSYDNGPMAIDYKLTAYSQCSVNGGACPDTRLGGKNDATDIEGEEIDGITTVRFKRPIAASDSQDMPIPTDGTQSYVVWAMGRLAADGLATKHTMRVEGNLQFNFARPAQRNCPAVKSRKPPMVMDPWVRKQPMGRMFTARIGPSGPINRGYEAITKNPSWGIAWYLEGILIPELYLQVGEEYTFKVQGGNEPSNGAKYHPLYITTDPFGGYDAKSDDEKQQETIYAGVMDGKPTAVGSYCEYTTNISPVQQETTSYMDFFRSLVLNCEGDEATMLTFTPTEDMPKLLYYQCFTHRHLGWKIHIVGRTTAGASTTQISLAALLVIAFSLVVGRLI